MSRTFPEPTDFKGCLKHLKGVIESVEAELEKGVADEDWYYVVINLEDDIVLLADAAKIQRTKFLHAKDNSGQSPF